MIRFAIAAGIAAAANLGTLYLAADVAGIPYVAGSMLAFGVGFIVAFILHKWWTFREPTPKSHLRESRTPRNFQTGSKRLPKQVLLSALLSLLNFVTYVGVIYLLVEWFSWWHLYAAIAGGILIPIENYVAFKFFIFRHVAESADLAK